MYLDKEYSDVLKTKDPYILLNSAIKEDCINKLVVMNDIMTSTEMTKQEVYRILFRLKCSIISQISSIDRRLLSRKDRKLHNQVKLLHYSAKYQWRSRSA